MKAKRFVSIWIFVNLMILLPTPILFYLGLSWPENWQALYEFRVMLIPILLLHVLYQMISGAVAIITLGGMIWQQLTRQTVPTILLVGEIYVILLGCFDSSPIAFHVIPQLYPLLPGW